MDVVFERRAMDLFERAVDRPEDQRQSWIESECGPDTALAKAVSALLRTLTDAQRRLPTDVQVRPLTEPEAPPPARVGPYRLTELVGAGGMGWVYRAERDDGLFAQTVAVKLIKSGLISAGGFGKFSTERKILAGLGHPGIARLYDGGADEAGRPYMIMEFIHGRPIDAALEGASVEAVIKTMIGVCSAVQSAHQALVVHADLKPGNILVEADGAPRLVDFGIGQLLSESGDEASRFGMTPAYASPQRRAGQRPAPADDIYALGVVLYELLSLTPPSDPLLLASEAARRAGGASATGRAAAIKGDLDAIVVKATAADPVDRYASVGALADDLGRWLDGFPVQARPRSPLYVLDRFVRRHPLAVAGAGLALAGVVIALVVTASLYGRAETARREAEARFNDTRGMANYMLFDLYDTLTPVPGTVAARERIAAESQAHLNRLATAREAPTDVQFDVARGLMRLAEVQGLAGFANLGQTRPAVENLRRADVILTRLHQLWPAREDIRLALAAVRLKRSIINLYGDHDAPRALSLVREAEALTLKARASRLDPASALLAWDERIHEGDALTWLYRTDESLALLKAEQARHETPVGGPLPPLQVALLQLDTLRFLGEAEFYAHDFAAAAKALRRGLALADRLLSDHPNDPRVIIRITTIAQTLGDSLADSNHIPEAVAVLRSGRAAAARLSEMDSGDLSSRRRVLSYDTDIAAGLSALGRESEAEGVIAEDHRAYLALLKTYPNDANLFRAYARSIRSRGEIKERQGQHAEACAWFHKAQATWAEFDRRWGISPSDRTDSLASLAEDLPKCRGATAVSRSAPSP